MSSIVTRAENYQSLGLVYETWHEDAVPDIVPMERKNELASVYTLFICTSTALTLFFFVSLVLSLTSNYFLDWGSSLLGFLGSLGLAAVGWLSRRQIES